MINHEITTLKNSNLLHSTMTSSIQNDTDSMTNCLIFSEGDFVNWCSCMTIEELEVCFRVESQQAVAYLRKNCRADGKYLGLELGELGNLEQRMKNLAINTYRKFIQALLFVSSKEYLDSITLNSDCLLFPEKVYKLLSASKYMAKQITARLHTDTEAQTLEYGQGDRRVKNPQLQPCALRSFQLLGQIIEKVQKNLSDKMKLNPTKYKNKQKIQQNPETLIHQFNSYWKYCSQQQKLSIWFLGYHDVKKAALKMLDLSYNYNEEYKIDVNEIQEYVMLAQKMGMRELGERIFSWRLGRSDNGITQYMRLVFNQLKERTRKKCGQSPKQKNKKAKKKKIRQRAIRRQSLDQSSNQTNETDIIYQRAFDINIDQIILTKIQRGISALADDINEQANLYYENRVFAFGRLREVLEGIGIGCGLKLYGSCCVGLAIRNSDVDVMVEEGVLEPYFGYYKGVLEGISAFFEYLQYYFSSFPWISNIKVIKSATIPIIKFTIDNNIQCESPLPHTTPVQFDLTVQTTDPTRLHLGILSTRQTEEWLREIPTLQTMAIIIKKQLAEKGFNETYYGGLNTYTVLVLLVALVRKERLGKEERAGVVLGRVLKFYSEEFQEDKFGVDLNCEQIFYEKTKEPQQSVDKQRQLQVKDPQGDHRNMTRNCYQFKKIKKILSDLYHSHFTVTRIKVQQICSAWNPKQNPLDQDSLLEWVEKCMREGEKMYMYGGEMEMEMEMEMLKIQ